jgi:outer membrane protein
MIRAVLLALALLPRAARADELRVAVVDLRRAVGETDEGRKATADLKRLFETKQKELDERQAELKKAAEDLDRKRTLLSAEAVRQKEAELQGKAQALRQLFERQQQEMGSKQAELIDGVLGRVQRIVAAIADAESLTLVLDRSQASTVVFARSHLDITNQVIRRYNAGDGRAKPTPAGKPAGKPASAPARRPRRAPPPHPRWRRRRRRGWARSPRSRAAPRRSAPRRSVGPGEAR